MRINITVRPSGRQNQAVDKADVLLASLRRKQAEIVRFQREFGMELRFDRELQAELRAMRNEFADMAANAAIVLAR